MSGENDSSTDLILSPEAVAARLEKSRSGEDGGFLLKWHQARYERLSESHEALREACTTWANEANRQSLHVADLAHRLEALRKERDRLAYTVDTMDSQFKQFATQLKELWEENTRLREALRKITFATIPDKEKQPMALWMRSIAHQALKGNSE